MRVDLDELARLDVRADVDGQLGEALEPVPRSGCASLRQLPDVVAEDRHRLAVAGEPVDLELRAADHEVGVHVGDVDAFAGLAGDCLDDREAVGDVAGGVLVEQRVEEREPGLPDA